MSEDGYTLTETLAALLIIGLAIAGLNQAFSAIARIQSHAANSLAEARALKETRQGLSSVLGSSGPIPSGARALRGDAESFEFDCGRSAPCGARIQRANSNHWRVVLDFGGRTRGVTMTSPDPLVFAYQADGVPPVAAWPPAEQSTRRSTLRAVSLARRSAQGDIFLAQARVWSDQPVDCQFDVISQECRGGAS